MKMQLASLNEIGRDEFLAAVGGVIENSPELLKPVAAQRPFSSVAALMDAIDAGIRGLAFEHKIALFRAHPELAGKEAAEGTMTSHSTTEQTRLGLSELSAEDHRRLTKLNAQYQTRFGFPFIVCLKHQPNLRSVFSQLEQRLLMSREEEIEAAVREILLVVQSRVEALVSDR